MQLELQFRQMSTNVYDQIKHQEMAHVDEKIE
jgi:hypothetical protein